MSVIGRVACIAAVAASIAGAGASPCASGGFDRHIVIDQFGYTPAMQKIAVVRSPVTGFDAAESFSPGPLYQVLDAESCAVVLEGAPVAWRAGQVDPAAGDKVWHFDFSALVKPGRYVIRDKRNAAVSAVFEIAANPYRQVLVQAVRYFYYQRAGTPKLAAYAGAGWADGADHVGPHQDTQARSVLKRDDPSTERDLHGGWWDAGDFNRYTNWHCDYLVSLLTTYRENPAIFTDDFNIPESGNGIPDLIDEVKWGMDWLVRMQNADGSVLSIALTGYSGTPPSAETKPSYYGSASTSASYSAAAAFAIGAKVFARIPALRAYAAELQTRAKRALAWAEAHPDVTFFNNTDVLRGLELGGGEQEYKPGERRTRALLAAIYLFDLTGDTAYENRIAALLPQTTLVTHNQLIPSDGAWMLPLLHYSALPNARRDLAVAVQRHYLQAFFGSVYPAAMSQRSAYLADLGIFYWGSNREIARTGLYLLAPAQFAMPGAPDGAGAFAAHYLHYMHGVNPLAKVYLSNMAAFGAENSVDSFYHGWFAKGSPWSSVKQSQYGPPPGYVVGGANPGYTWAEGCPQLHPLCGSAPPSPPFGQPPMKSYADFNDSWPVNSWGVTESSNGYQVEYIRLLAHFVTAAGAP